MSTNEPNQREGLQKDPQEWTSGDDPATDAQRSYLETLSRETGEEVPNNLTKAGASEMIDRLRGQAGFESNVEGDTGQGVGLGPMEGDEAIDDDTDFRHTPQTPPVR